MKWRVIVRLSYKRDTGLRQKAAKYLKDCGLRPSQATGTWEGDAVLAQDAAKQFGKIFDLLSDPHRISFQAVN